MLTRVSAHLPTYYPIDDYAAKQENAAAEEEEFKGGQAPDFDKINLDKQYIPSLYDDENFDFKVVKP